MKSQDQPATTSHQIHTYTELEQKIHKDLRVQHPEWIEPTGDCPECDERETRLRKLLKSFTRRGSNESPLSGSPRPHRSNDPS